MIPDVDTLRDRARRRAPARFTVLLFLLGAAFVVADYVFAGYVDTSVVWTFCLPLFVGLSVMSVVVSRTGSTRLGPAAGLPLRDRRRVMSGIVRGRLDTDPQYRAVQLVELKRIERSAGAWPVSAAVAAVSWWVFSLPSDNRGQGTIAVAAGVMSVASVYTAALWLGARRITRET